jgi:hypothetical protein
MEGTPVGSEMGKIIQRVVLACVLLTAGLGSALAQATSEPEALARAAKFADQVVRVIPQRTDGASAEVGFGLIVGERAGKVYIATPNHVVFGLERPSVLSAAPGVVFQGDRYNTIPARRLDRASPDDLAVLEVAPPQGLALPRAPIVLAAQLARGTWAWNIGIGQDWDMPDRAGGLGPLDAVTGLRRIGALRTPPGASGGAGVTDSGVIGIVLQDASDYSLLLPVERIVQLFTAWGLPVNLLTSAGPSTEPTAATQVAGLSITTAKSITEGTTLSGSLVPGEDRHFFQFKASSTKTRVILRKRPKGGFQGAVDIYDHNENRVAREAEGVALVGPGQDQPITLSFESHPGELYYIAVTALGSKTSSDYELTVRQE